MFNHKEYVREYNKKWYADKSIVEKKEYNRHINKRGVERARENKRRAVSMLGGKCQKCGYDRCLAALEFHHIDDKTKEHKINKCLATWSLLVEEIKKCMLLCSNCHKETHYGEA